MLDHEVFWIGQAMSEFVSVWIYYTLTFLAKWASFIVRHNYFHGPGNLECYFRSISSPADCSLFDLRSFRSSGHLRASFKCERKPTTAQRGGTNNTNTYVQTRSHLLLASKIPSAGGDPSRDVRTCRVTTHDAHDCAVALRDLLQTIN